MYYSGEANYMVAVVITTIVILGSAERLEEDTGYFCGSVNVLCPNLCANKTDL